MISEQTRQRMREARLGKKWPEEIREKFRKAHQGKVLSEEHKKKISKSLSGRKASLEARINNSRVRLREKCYNWKGGVEIENRRVRQSIYFRLWREAVFARDNWTCQGCFNRGGELHPHHIKSFSKYPELRFAIDNGITLCGECHAIEHPNLKRKVM